MKEFSSEQIDLVLDILCKRWGEKVNVEAVEVEREGVSNAALFWERDEYGFIVVLNAKEEYFGFFFDASDTQYGSGVNTYGSVRECVTKLLQSHADFISEIPS